MAAIVRVKRKLDDKPAEALLLACKRLRYADDSKAACPLDDVKSLFKFVGTLKNQAEPISNHIKEALKKDENKSKIHKLHVADLHSRIRDNCRTSSQKSRFKLVNSFRALDYKELDQIDFDHGNTDDDDDDLRDKDHHSKLWLYDVIQEDETLQSEVSSKAKKALPDIACNGVPMIRENLSLEEALKREEQYVYDIYYTDSGNFDDLILQQTFSLEKCSLDPDFYDFRENEESYEDEDDSNDENFYTNDYPEEDSDFEKGYDYYGEYDEDEIISKVKTCHIEESDSDEDYNVNNKLSETDIYLHGEHYAKYKAKAMEELILDNADEDSSFKDDFLITIKCKEN